MKQSIYLDYAAATPVDKRVLKVMEPYLTGKFYNPAATYYAARQSKSDLIAAKKRIAAHLGVTYSEVIMTSGGSEANNLAINGLMAKFPDQKILISAIEHESVIRPAEKYNCNLIGVNHQGIVDIDKLVIDDNVILLSVMLANNEIGSIQPLGKIAAKLNLIRRDRRKRNVNLPLFFHTDAAQAPLYLDINAHRLGVDMMTINGGKIYGPKQTGILFVSKQLQLQPQILGGGQQRGVRSGSESVAQAIGLAEALDMAVANREKYNQHLSELRDYFASEIVKIYPKIIINGPKKNRLPSNLHLTFPGHDNERLLYQLDEAGIMASAGSACAASSEEPSHVLAAMNLSDESARSSIRFTLGRQNTKYQITHTLNTLKNLLY